MASRGLCLQRAWLPEGLASREVGPLKGQALSKAKRPQGLSTLKGCLLQNQASKSPGFATTMGWLRYHTTTPGFATTRACPENVFTTLEALKTCSHPSRLSKRVHTPRVPENVFTPRGPSKRPRGHVYTNFTPPRALKTCLHPRGSENVFTPLEAVKTSSHPSRALKTCSHPRGRSKCIHSPRGRVHTTGG